MIIYTIGFCGKDAELFFNLLVKNGVKKVIDIRLNNSSQLSGFTNIKHLPYFLKLHGIKYEYKNIFAPTDELLKDFKKKKISWKEYENNYLETLNKRKVLQTVNINDFENSALLCSESSAKMCHRRILAEYLQKNFDNILIKHL